MSEFIFFYPKNQIAGALARRGFVVARGRKPVPTSIRVDEFDATRNRLVVSAKAEGSGAFYVPCSDARDGFFYASTESLPSDRRPRSLYLELCRGQISRIQRKRAEWSYSGFSTPERLKGQIRRAVQKFSVLVTTDVDAPDYDASIFSLFTALCEISRRLNEQYLSQTLAARRRTASWISRFGFSTNPRENWTAPYDALFAGSKTNHAHPKLEPLFRSINLRVAWRDVERGFRYDWSQVVKTLDEARKRRLRTTLGPLTRWGTDIPSRLQSPTLSAETLRRDYMNYVESAVEALGNRVERWVVAANVETAPNLTTFEFRLTSAMQAAAYIRDNLPNAEVFIGIEQAFGDAARFRDPPLVYGEDLASKLAARRVFDGFYVEADFGLVPYTTAPRDPMELHRFFDRWRSLGVKIAVAMSCPSAAPFAAPSSLNSSEQFEIAFADKQKRSFFFRSSFENKPIEEQLWSVQVQQELARRFYSSALACKTIDELFWSRWLDVQPMSYEEYEELSSVFDGAQSTPPFEQTLMDDEKRVLVESEEAQESEDDFFHRDDSENDEIFDEIDLASSDASFTTRSESVSYSAETEASEDFTPTSGLFDVHGRPKPTLYKLAALRRAYLDD